MASAGAESPHRDVVSASLVTEDVPPSADLPARAQRGDPIYDRAGARVRHDTAIFHDSPMKCDNHVARRRDCLGGHYLAGEFLYHLFSLPARADSGRAKADARNIFGFERSLLQRAMQGIGDGCAHNVPRGEDVVGRPPFPVAENDAA